MKKTASVLIFVFVFLSTAYYAPSTSHAQDFSAQKAYQDYLYQQTNYQNSLNEYQEAKTFYKSNPTLQLREEARKKTLSMLKNRDQLMVVYLTLLRIQLASSTGLFDNEKAEVYNQLNPEIQWYQDHLKSYSDGDDLNTLFAKSDEGKGRHQYNTKPVIYNLLFQISLSQEIGFRVDHQTIYTDIKNTINDQVSLGNLKIDPFNRWLSDTDAVLTSLSQNESAAKAKIPSFYKQTINILQTYNTTMKLLKDSVSPLSKLNNYLSEMLTLLESGQK